MTDRPPPARDPNRRRLRLLGLLCALLALLVCRTELNVMALIGILLLIGIVIGNAGKIKHILVFGAFLSTDLRICHLCFRRRV